MTCARNSPTWDGRFKIVLKVHSFDPSCSKQFSKTLEDAWAL